MSELSDAIENVNYCHDRIVRRNYETNQQHGEKKSEPFFQNELECSLERLKELTK